MRVRRSILNFGTSALLMGVTMAVALPASKWLLFWLGESAAGAVRVVNAAFGYLTLLELGLGGAIGPLLARAVSRGDERALHETVAAGSRAYLWVAGACISIGLLLTPVVPWFAPDLSPSQVTDLRQGWVVQLAAFLPLTLLPLRSVYDARQLGYVVNLLLTAQALLITATQLVLARAGWGVTGQAAAQVVGNLLFALALSAGVFRSHPGLLRSMIFVPTTPETRRSLWNLSAPTLILNVCGRVGVLSDDLVVGRFLGTRMVTSLVYTQKLAVMGQTVLHAVGNASWAALAELHSQGQNETFNRRLVEMTRLVVLIAAIGLVPVVAYNRAFIRIWLGPGFHYGGDTVAVLACVNAVLLATQALWCWCFTATGNVRYVVRQSVAAAAVNLVASVSMTRWLGLPGPLIGSTIALVSVGLWTLPLTLYRVFGTPPAALARAFVVPFAAGAVAAGLLRALSSYHEPAGWPGLAAEMSLSALAMLALSVVFLLTPEDRSLWRLRLSAIRPARPVTGVAP